MKMWRGAFVLGFQAAVLIGGVAQLCTVMHSANNQPDETTHTSRADDMEGLGTLILALCYGYSGGVAN
jgi:hypothetical protein